jgi:peptidoglycan/xylan/chitin deacetylase (PgdA/CDA1 family)
MYHEVPARVTSATYFAVPRDRFAAHLDALRTLGLSARSLEALLPTPGRGTVALTFDDGHETHYRQAFPLLVERGFTATFFVTSSWVGTPGYVTWDQLREMAEAGMSIQSHTRSHPFLSELTSEELESELSDSKSAVEREISRPCVTLALPGGDRPRGWSPADYARLGYRHVATSLWGPNVSDDRGARDGARFIRRYTVRRDTSLRGVGRQALALRSAYDLEGLRQMATHAVRSVLGPRRYASWRRTVLSSLGR